MPPSTRPASHRARPVSPGATQALRLGLLRVSGFQAGLMPPGVGVDRLAVRLSKESHQSGLHEEEIHVDQRDHGSQGREW